MELNLKHKKLSSLLFQRNFLGGLALALLVIAMLQTALLFVKSEKIIILPPELKQEFWIEGNKFAPTYLEEQGMYFTHLLLDVSSSNILSQGEVLLRYVDPAFHEQFKTRLFAEEQRLKKDNVSLHFTVIDCEVYPSESALEITGDLHAYVAFKKISTHRETYRLQFSAKKGRLFLKTFEILQSDNKDLSLPQELEVTAEPTSSSNHSIEQANVKSTKSYIQDSKDN
jgi:conjugal transfer pilus assembly protein TraE